MLSKLTGLTRYLRRIKKSRILKLYLDNLCSGKELAECLVNILQVGRSRNSIGQAFNARMNGSLPAIDEILVGLLSMMERK